MTMTTETTNVSAVRQYLQDLQRRITAAIAEVDGSDLDRKSVV